MKDRKGLGRSNWDVDVESVEWATLDVTGGLLRLQDQAALAIGVTVTLFYWGEPGSTVVIDH